VKSNSFKNKDEFYRNQCFENILLQGKYEGILRERLVEGNILLAETYCYY